MHRHPHSVFAAALFIGSASTAATSVEILKEMPAKGAVRNGEIVYVDDGHCPAGEVKKITGGQQSMGKPRQVECVKRPDNR